MTTIIRSVEIFVNIMILALIMKMTIHAREFFFNPILRPVDMLTEPPLKLLRKIFRPTQTGWEYTPFVCIAIMLIIQSLILFIVTPDGLAGAFLVSLNSNLAFMVKVMTVCFVVALVIPENSSNPLARFLTGILKPLQSVFAFPFKEKIPKLVATYIGFIVLMVILIHSINSVRHDLIDSMPVTNSLIHNFTSRTHLDLSQTLFSWKLILYSTMFVVQMAISSLNFLSVIVFLGAILSWVNLDPRHPVPQFVYAISEPILAPVRRLIPSVGGLDISPVICIIGIIFITRLSNHLMQAIIMKTLG